ncbi:hypothetical protein EDF52_12411 [Curtobacterium sp. PhB42]|nr:hypothetical protein EDF33_11216 [Curtobacterium sp. PhB146]TDW38459.1 hypothetical protein EDF52_12411 [Curtobacterium sp. PhB42]TDW48466.1 hypothetical protein EDF47_12111 [Curtobacterium sp. PhB190]
MVAWPIVEVPLKDVSLDVDNVRIPVRGALTQRDLLVHMYDNEDLPDLMQSILQNGYIDNEIPVVVEHQGGFVVLEGNRRVSALKLLADPELLPNVAAKVERLLSRFGSDEEPLSRIRVMLAPSWDAAQPLLARLHTRATKKRWIREQQAEFFHAQWASGRSLEALQEQYPSEARGIVRFIKMGEMRRAVIALPLQGALRDYVHGQQLPMSSLEYAYNNPRIQKALGLEFGRDGKLLNKRLTAGQQQALALIVDRFRNKTLNTRSPELMSKYDDNAAFAAQLGDIVSGTRASRTEPQIPPEPDSSFGADRIAAPDPGDSAPAEPPTVPASSDKPGSSPETTPRGPNRSETRIRLAMEPIDWSPEVPGLHRRLMELRMLNVVEFPHAGMLLVRSVLECTIKHFLRTVPNAAQQRGGDTLGPALSALQTHFASDRRMTALLSRVNKTGQMSQDQFVGSLGGFNAATHEPGIVVFGPDVHRAWDTVKPILQQLQSDIRTAQVGDAHG